MGQTLGNRSRCPAMPIYPEINAGTASMIKHSAPNAKVDGCPGYGPSRWQV